jgi:hypothetical protein
MDLTNFKLWEKYRDLNINFPARRQTIFYPKVLNEHKALKLFRGAIDTDKCDKLVDLDMVKYTYDKKTDTVKIENYQ